MFRIQPAAYGSRLTAHGRSGGKDDRRTPCPRRAASEVHWHELDREPAVGRVHAALCICACCAAKDPKNECDGAMGRWPLGQLSGLWAAGTVWAVCRGPVLGVAVGIQCPSRLPVLALPVRSRSLALLSTLIADVDSTMHNARRQAPDLMQHAAQCARAGRTATRNATDSASARLPHDHTQHTATTPYTRTAPPRLLPTTTDRSTLSSLPRPHTRFLHLFVLSPLPDSLFRLSVVTSHSPKLDSDHGHHPPKQDRRLSPLCLRLDDPLSSLVRVPDPGAQFRSLATSFL